MTEKTVTIERHITEKQKQHPQATGTLTALLYDMALAAKMIASQVRRAGLIDILGEAEGHNVYGEQQQKLDVYADSVIFKLNDHTHRLCAMVSEERDEIIEIPRKYGKGRYVLLYDPLDGSSNIDLNVSIGTIFSIHRKVSTGGDGTLEDILQPGSRLVAAGYVLYGSSTMMVYTTEHGGVHGFTLEPSIGEFLLSNEDIRIPSRATYYSTNQGYEKGWTHGVRRYTKWLQGIDGEGHPSLGLRYTGSLVADFHRTLLRGGVFYYPGDMQQPEGKMRLMVEAQAIAFIARHAGGYASDGYGDILEIKPHKLHQRTPLFVGSRDLVVQAEHFIRQHDQDWLKQYLPYREGRQDAP
ncbi:MAG: class 1 fructose-bisphosphatase [Anaerolineae bacterium]|nr:class 1 fructose-bisphosphatase [Anaerolineae bacterium]NUQ06578.1 class 1 fructose-bisphosphatase [Anaerolineae bacterium]